MGRAGQRPALPRVLIAGEASSACDAVERILTSRRGFTVVRVRTIGNALAALRPANGGALGHFDCCVAAREVDGSALEIAEAASSLSPEPFLLALENTSWRQDEREELGRHGARLLPTPVTPGGLLDLLQKGELDPILPWTEEHGLSPRGYQVLSLAVRGASDVQIASILEITESTVYDHWKAVRRTTRADSRSAVIALVARYIAKRSNWPSLPD